MPDTLFILILAPVIFGPKRLPEIARQVAKFLAQFRMMRDDLKRQMENQLLKIELEAKESKLRITPEKIHGANHCPADPPSSPTNALPQSHVS
jgi:Sec-independent protein translocase protein TatA